MNSKKKAVRKKKENKVVPINKTENTPTEQTIENRVGGLAKKLNIIASNCILQSQQKKIEVHKLEGKAEAYNEVAIELGKILTEGRP